MEGTTATLLTMTTRQTKRKRLVRGMESLLRVGGRNIGIQRISS
jgi:hypothetical protein